MVACYSIGESRMYVPGEAVQGIPVEYPLTHEYGHHIASWRLNNPWDALDWGAKHWASAVRVCTYVEKGILFPGNQGAHYRDDPGEGFADGYAHLHYPDVPWYYNELMRPGPLEFAAIRKDVLEPWSEPRSRTFRGRLGPHRAERTFKIRAQARRQRHHAAEGPGGRALHGRGRDGRLRGRQEHARRRGVRRRVVPPPAGGQREDHRAPPRGHRAVRAQRPLARVIVTNSSSYSICRFGL